MDKNEQLEIHQLPYWTSGSMQLTQNGKTIHLEDAGIARIVAARYSLQDFTIEDLVEALQNLQGNNRGCRDTATRQRVNHLQKKTRE